MNDIEREAIILNSAWQMDTLKNLPKSLTA
jgi:hypothetical protein